MRDCGEIVFAFHCFFVSINLCLLRLCGAPRLSSGGIPVATSIDKIYEHTMELPDESKAILAERIVEYLGAHMNPDLERLHLDTVKRRRAEIQQGHVQPVDGQEALAAARGIINE
jgi:hypothetical protein